MNQQVKYQTAATLEYQPLEGRASAATVTIKTKDLLDLKTAVDGATATVDPVATTVDSVSGKSQDNPRMVKLTATTNVRVGGIYLLTGAQGQEWVEVQGISAGDYVTIKNPLMYDYAVGATFVGTRLTYALTADNAQSPGEDCDVDFRVEWHYTVSSSAYMRETLYDVSLHPWFRSATTPGLRRWNPDLFSRWEELGNTDWEAELDAAFDLVIMRCDARGWRPNAIVGMDKLALPTYWQLALTKALGNVIPPLASNDPGDWIDRCELQLERALDLAGKTITWIDEDQDNQKAEGEAGKNSMSVRLST